MAETLIDQALKSTLPARLRACAALDDKARICRECSDAADRIEELSRRIAQLEGDGIESDAKCGHQQQRIEELESALRGCHEACENAVAHTETAERQLAAPLISTAERLPEIGVQVICTGFCYSLTTKEKTDQRWWAIAHRDDINRWIPERHGATDGIDQLYPPTHWAPLPNLRALPDRRGCDG